MSRLPWQPVFARLSRFSWMPASVPTRFAFSTQPQSVRLASAWDDPDLREAPNLRSKAWSQPARRPRLAASELDGPNLRPPLEREARSRPARWLRPDASGQDGPNLLRLRVPPGAQMRQKVSRVPEELETRGWRQECRRLEHPPGTWLSGSPASTLAGLPAARGRAST